MQAASLLLAVMGLQGVSAQDAAAPQDYTGMPTSVIDNQASMYVAGRRYAEAVPSLQELVARLGESTDPQVIARVESFRYFLAMGYAMSGDYKKAEDAFAAFFKSYPKSNRIREAREFYGDVLAQNGKFPEAAAQYEALLALSMSQAEKQPILEKLTACYFEGGEWKKAIVLLTEAYQRAVSPEQREEAAVKLCQAYIEDNQSTRVIEILPGILSGTPRARLNVDFNMALVRGGDKMLESGNDVLALLFYQLAMPVEKLREWNERLTAEATEERKKARQGANPQLVINLTRRLKDLEREQLALKEVPDFSEELAQRSAQAYFGMERYYEAFWAYWDLFKNHPEGKAADDSAYAAFVLAAQLNLDDKAREAGLAYMTAFPDGRHWDDVSVQLGQIFIRQQNYSEAVAFYDTVLKRRPDHPAADQVIYYKGIAQFQDSLLPEARATFLDLRQKHPKSEHRSEAAYWMAMTHLFAEEYDKALEAFRGFMEESPAGPLYEDAYFRVGVCEFGLEKYPESAAQLEAFLTQFPPGTLTPEVHMLAGQVYGGMGDLDKAIAHYEAVERTAVRQEQTDLAVMQAGRVYETLGQFAEMEAWFSRYLETYGTKGDYTQAIHQRGFAQKSQGKNAEMLEDYRDAVKKYGNQPDATGIDLILDVYPGEFQTVRGTSAAPSLLAEAEAARAAGERTKFLRLCRVVPPEENAGGPPEFEEADLEMSPPAVLLWMADVSQQKNPAFAERALRHLTTRFKRSQWVAQAWLRLGELAAARKDYPAALKAFGKSRDLAPLDAAQAIKRMADCDLALKKFPEAIAHFQEVLQVKEWRGPLWPECLYGIGECLSAEGKLREAYAYYQRIYVLYGGYPAWAAKAYLRCAEISEKLALKTDAIRTLGELLANKSLSKQPEYAEAQRKLETLQ